MVVVEGVEMMALVILGPISLPSLILYINGVEDPSTGGFGRGALHFEGMGAF